MNNSRPLENGWTLVVYDKPIQRCHAMAHFRRMIRVFYDGQNIEVQHAAGHSRMFVPASVVMELLELDAERVDAGVERQ